MKSLFSLISTPLALLLVSCGGQDPSFQDKAVFALNVNVVPTEDMEAMPVPMPQLSESEVDDILVGLDPANPETGDAAPLPDGPQSDDNLNGGAGDDSTGGDDTGNTDDDSAPSEEIPGDDTTAPGETDSGNPANDDNGAPRPSEDGRPPVLAEPSPSEIRACSKLTGADASRIHVAGSHNVTTITSGSVIAAKVVGDQNKFELNLNGGAGVRLSGICLFLAGNQAEASVQVNLPVQSMIYIGRGNQSHGEIAIGTSGGVNQMVVDLSGNASYLKVTGAAACPTPRLKGQGSSLVCSVR